MQRILFVFILLASVHIIALSQSTDRVFFIGENQKTYDKLIVTYNTHLLEVCDNSMDVAYEKWSGILYDIEKYVMAEHFDIRGVKLWMNVFFDGKGKIDNIVYYPKPVSKNMNYEQLSKILDKFVKTYNTSITAKVPFSHYGSASFPVFYAKVNNSAE